MRGDRGTDWMGLGPLTKRALAEETGSTDLSWAGQARQGQALNARGAEGRRGQSAVHSGQSARRRGQIRGSGQVTQGHDGNQEEASVYSKGNRKLRCGQCLVGT